MRIEKPEIRDIPRLKELWKLGFSEPEEGIQAFFDTGFSPERAMAAYLEGEAAAVVYWFDTFYQGRKLAYIFALTTDPVLRGRGIAGKLMKAVHVHLKEGGYAGVLLYPGQPSLRVFYRGLGYGDECTWGEITAIAHQCEHRLGMTEIGAAEYEALRQGYLPVDGVSQPGESIVYLATYAKLYRGKGFLLAAVKEGNALCGLELLGDTVAASAIVAALGCETGWFRTPGTQVPGAMFLALEAGTEAPGYFGLTFD